MKNKYRIIETVYQSERTNVYRAIRKKDALPVVLKTKSGLLSSENKSELLHEYQIGKRLNCKGSVKYLALEQTEGKSVLVFQDDKMNSLKSILPRKGFDLSQFFTLAIEIVRSIEEIHLKNIIHKDINPSNIIVNSALDGIKLIGFGLATRISEEVIGFEPPADFEGTIAYISPEQTGRINKAVDSRSDLYSLGVTFYRMITGKLAFDETDSGELIYSHIAKIPVPVSDIRQDIPKAVSLVIEKLLKKSPDERYQTAGGIKNDLLYLQEALSAGKEPVDFNPGKNEHKNRIILPGKLYGRKKEINRLLDCFNKSKNAAQVVTVTGPAGIGKTALIRELYTPVTTEKGFFLSGKFDQLSKGLAYTALADALKDFQDQCSGWGEEIAGRFQAAIQSSVGEFGQVLIDIVPEFHGLIGEQQSTAPISPRETLIRRNTVFSNLIRDICAVGYPLILFLDDLQWADSATLSLLEKIVEKNSKNLFIILSYRSDEISQVHPAKLFLETLKSKNITLTNLHLENLNIRAVNDWTDDILPEKEKDAKELAGLVMSKTEGNPFYITSFLYMIIERNYIRHRKDGSLLLDLEAVTNIPADADVVEHLIRKIQSLKKKYADFIAKVSVLGNSFFINTINLLLEKEYRDYQDKIEMLVETHLLVKSGDIIMFAHDRVQQAASTLLSDESTRILHLKAAQNIRAALDARGLADENIEEYIHHCNAAEGLIVNLNQRLKLAKLNIIMGKRLKSNAAYHAAENSFARAIDFLPQQPFDTDYKMAIELYTEYGEILFLNLKYQEGKKQFDTVIAHSKSPVDSANVYVKQINHHASHHKLKESMEIALHALKTLGVSLPKRFLKFSTITDLLKIRFMLRNTSPEDIIDFPVTREPLFLAQMDVLSAAAHAAYIGNPDYYPIIIFKIMKLSIPKGNCIVSPFAYMSYAVMLCRFGNPGRGFSFGKAAIGLMERLEANNLHTKLHFLFGAFVYHWEAPVWDSIKVLEASNSSGLETGDYEYASYSANYIMHTSFYFGKNIAALLNQYPKLHRMLADFGKDHSIFDAKFFHQFLITMNDPDCDGIKVSGDIIDENRLVSLLEERQDLTSLGICMIAKMQLAYMAGDYKTAIRVRTKAMSLLNALTGFIFIPVCHFFAALTCVACYRKYKADPILLKAAKNSLKKLKKWGSDAPGNYLNKARLVEAELLSVKGKKHKALRLYEAVIENSAKAGNNMVLGIACESMGRYLISLGLRSIGLMQIRRSIFVFQDWGALNKSNRLRKEYDIEISKENILPECTGSSFPRPSQDIKKRIDLDVLAGTIKSLTGDLRFETRLEKLLAAVMQNSGATRVVYIHVEDKNFKVRAERYSNETFRICDGNDTRPSSFGLPVALLEKCYSGSADYILENIEIEKSLAGGKHRNKRFKSVLILSLIRNKSVMGMVYLENDLVENAFREDHVQFLSLLSGQAAIAIENALIFENLKRERNHSSNIIQHSPILIIGIDTNGITTFINPAFIDITGYTKEELVGKNWWKLFFPGKEYAQVEQVFQKFAQEEIVDYEMRLTCKNNDKRDIVWNSSVRRDKNNNILEIIGFGNEISERKQIENEVRNLRNYLSNIINSMPSLLIGVDIEGRITQWNKKAEQTTGVAAGVAQGKTLPDVFPEMVSEMKKISDSIRTKQTKQELKRPRQSGNGTCFEDLIIYPLITNGVEGAVIRIDDVTEKIRMEEMMIQSEKMLSVGGLAAGMAHEINNPLAGMMQTADVMKKRLTNMEIAANRRAAEEANTSMEAIQYFMKSRGIMKMISDINQSGRRVAEIVSNMLSFARKSGSMFSPNNLSDLIDKTLELASTDYDLKKKYDFKAIEIKKIYEEKLPEVLCEGPMLQQVLLNLFRNGAQAMQEANIEKPRFIVKTYVENLQQMLVSEIEDNGPGMDEATRKRIFEPFFTTKPVGVGTGLGLSVSYFIITEHHSGEMSVESKPGFGTKFIIKLPLQRA